MICIICVIYRFKGLGCYNTRMLLDASEGGTMKIKTADEVRELIDYVSLNDINNM